MVLAGKEVMSEPLHVRQALLEKECCPTCRDPSTRMVTGRAHRAVPFLPSVPRELCRLAGALFSALKHVIDLCYRSGEEVNFAKDDACHGGLLDKDGISDDIHLFNEKLREWEDYYNYHRPHGALEGQTPFERLIAKTRADVSVGS